MLGGSGQVPKKESILGSWKSSDFTDCAMHIPSLHCAISPSYIQQDKNDSKYGIL